MYFALRLKRAQHAAAWDFKEGLLGTVSDPKGDLIFVIEELRSGISTPVADRLSIGYDLVLDYESAQDFVGEINNMILRADEDWVDILQQLRNLALRCNTGTVELVYIAG